MKQDGDQTVKAPSFWTWFTVGSVAIGWLNPLFERAPKVFEVDPSTPSREKQLTKKVEALEQRLAKKDSVIAEISAEYVHLKKELGEL